MKKYAVHITLAVVIIAIAVVIGCRYFNKQDSPVISNSVETSEPEITEEVTEQTYTETIITEDTGTTEEENSIDWNSIDPKVHAPFNEVIEIPELDSTIQIYLHQNCPAFADSTIEDVDFTATQYLKEYYNGTFGDAEWLEFVTTGDVSVLNLKKQSTNEVEDSSEQSLEELCEELGVDISEVLELIEATEGTSGSSSNTNSNDTNGGGGSTPTVTPETNQSGVDEDSFVSPEINTPNNGNSQGGNNKIPGEKSPNLIPGMGGDGGEIVGDTVLNP